MDLLLYVELLVAVELHLNLADPSGGQFGAYHYGDDDCLGPPRKERKRRPGKRTA